MEWFRCYFNSHPHFGNSIYDKLIAKFGYACNALPRTQNCVMVNLLNRWKWFRKRLVRCGLKRSMKLTPYFILKKWKSNVKKCKKDFRI